jgi:peptidoglycan/xylan/chitin deacetylase (PgdA/CDA1 family)
MYVSPESLDLHLSLLKRHLEIVHLEEWLRAQNRGEELPKQACAITFDDGWRDNFEYAFPVLSRHKVPATIFLASSFVNTNIEFWPSRLQHLLRSLNPKEPMAPNLESTLRTVRERAARNGSWTPEDIDAAIDVAKNLEESLITRLLADGEELYPRTVVRSLLTEVEIRQMAASDLVRFGSHSRTHFRCRAGTSSATLQDEIVNSKRETELLAGKPVELFSFPNGDYSKDALELVRRHYIGAVTTHRGWHRAGGDSYRIRRIGIHDDVSRRAASFLGRLSGLS